jgi:signal transduction histidine kinase
MNATLESKVDEKTEELEKLNMKLKDKVDEEVLKNRKKDQMLFNQSKMASMGEMIGNIAHQWRQPLSTISTAASGMSIKIDYDLASKEELKKDLELIVDTTQYLSHTIEDFRSFFKATKDKEKFCLTKLIKKDINIMNSAFKNNFIEVVYEFEDVELNTIQNELTQSILNILTNAKDALSQNSSKNRLIIIKTFIKDRFVFITIQDNGGGIDEKIMDKIFEPYFTTKHQSQGTGIGLYMTREIVVKHLNGTIKVKNKNFKHKEKEYLGACFEIKLPLDSLT